MPRIQSIQELDDFLQSESSRSYKILFKHSTRCPLSASRKTAFEADLQKENIPHEEVGYIYVVEDRAISNKVADRFGIDHQSPQLLIVKNDSVVHDSSHFNIKLTKALADID